MIQTVERSQGGMAYRRQGSGSPVVLVHGIPGAGRAWAEVETHLRSDVEVIVPDLMAFGDSATPPAMSAEQVGLTAQVDALEALLDEIGIARAVLVGHDFGAPICTLLAAQRPDLTSGLVLLAGNTFSDTPIPFPLSLVTAPVIGSVIARLLFSAPSLQMMLRQGVGPGGTPPDRDLYLGPPSQRAAIALIFNDALTKLEAMYSPVEDALRTLRVPVVVGWGDRDAFFDLAQGRRTAEAAGGRLRVFEQAGHFLPHERASEVAEEIEKLLDDVAR